MIRFACPRCNSVLDAPDQKAGSKVACPKCQQRLQIPGPPLNKTILAPLVEHRRNPGSSRTSSPPAGASPAVTDPADSSSPELLTPESEEADQPHPTKGRTLAMALVIVGCLLLVAASIGLLAALDSHRTKAQPLALTLIILGCLLLVVSVLIGLFVARNSHRKPLECVGELEVLDDDDSRKFHKHSFACARCGSWEEPESQEVTATAGWILFVVLLVSCFPLCWLGFSIRETWDFCPDCGYSYLNGPARFDSGGCVWGVMLLLGFFAFVCFISCLSSWAFIGSL